MTGFIERITNEKDDSSDTMVGKYIRLKSHFTWTIDHFSQLSEDVNECIDSPSIFVGPEMHQDEWVFSLYPKGSDECAGEHISLGVLLKSSRRRMITARVIFTIVDDYGRHHGVYVIEEIFQRGLGWSFQEFFSLEKLDKEKDLLLQCDCLVICCQINYVRVAQKPSLYPTNMAKEFLKLFESKEFSDITLGVNGKEIKAHKFVLAGRSSVFKEMLTKQSDHTQNRLETTDMAYGDLTEMLRFMYTAEPTPPEKISAGLLAAADKYQVEDLKAHCEKQLVKKINIQNAGELLLLASRHSAEILRKRTFKYISENASAVRGTDQWKQLRASLPHLDQIIEKGCRASKRKMTKREKVT